MIVIVALSIGWVPLRAHVLTMIAGQCFTAFFAVWTVHHDCEPTGRIARTQRGWLKNVASYDMFHHVEHHLFPAVPTCHLPELSRRLDRVAPEYKDLTVY
jgi:fatty acid desaturase